MNNVCLTACVGVRPPVIYYEDDDDHHFPYNRVERFIMIMFLFRQLLPFPSRVFM